MRNSEADVAAFYSRFPLRPLNHLEGYWTAGWGNAGFDSCAGCTCRAKKPLGGSHAERVNHRRYRVLSRVATSPVRSCGTS